jgi:ATPases with chaperone activity, ATP-binding subunit
MWPWFFISRLDGDNTVNEGLCLKCAKELGLPQVDDMMKRMGISDDDLDTLNNEMLQAFDGVENVEDLSKEDNNSDPDEEEGKTATFPFLNRLFNGDSSSRSDEQSQGSSARADRDKEHKGDKKRKYLESYCLNLTERAKAGKLDPVIGRGQEIERVIQILNRRQKNNPCLIGEPGVGKTAIAEGLAQRISEGKVALQAAGEGGLSAGSDRSGCGHPVPGPVRVPDEGPHR